MKKNVILIKVTLILMVLVVLSFSKNTPNFVLIMTDDQGWGSITSRSDIQKTPGLDTLIAHGINFNRFYSASAVCSPTRGSLITGRNPIRLGIPSANSGHLTQDEKTISELAKDKGYTTGHFGKWHLGVLTKIRQESNRGGQAEHYSPPWYHGYDHTFATESKVPTYNPMIKVSHGDYSLEEGEFYNTYYWTEPANVPNEEEGDTVSFDELKGDDAKLIIDRALQFIDSAHQAETPFLTTIWIHSPHAPVTVPQDTALKYYPDITNEKDRVYYTSVEMLSNQILRLYKHLESIGELDNTFLFFNSDNGSAHTQNVAPQEATGGLRGGKTELWEGGIAVPGILVWPQMIPQNLETDFPAFTSDLYPTIKAILQSDVPDQKPVDGINLLPVIQALVAGQEDLQRLKPMGFIYSTSRVWMDGDMKIIKDKGSSEWEMFNLTEDRNETNNLVTGDSANFESLLEAFNQWHTLVKNDEAFDFAEETNAMEVVSIPTNPFLLHDFLNKKIQVYDLQGKLLGTYINQSSDLSWKGTLNNQSLQRGMYLLRLSTHPTKVFKYLLKY